MNQQELNNRPKHIVIMGAGLVGSMHAIYLARRGYQVSSQTTADTDARSNVA